MVARGKLHEAEDRQQSLDEMSPHLVLRVVHQGHERRAGALDSATMRVDQGAAAERDRMWQSDLELRDHVAAALGVLVGQIPASGTELDQSKPCQAIGSQVFVAAVA